MKSGVFSVLVLKIPTLVPILEVFEIFFQKPLILSGLFFTIPLVLCHFWGSFSFVSATLSGCGCAGVSVEQHTSA
jgi:hypothetical protein